MATTPDTVLKDLKAKKYAPVYFLQGDEPYYIDLVSDYIEKNCLPEHEKSFNQTILYGKDVNINTILQHARKFPMMADRQVVIVREAQDISDLGKEAGDKMLDAYLNNPLPSTVLVFCHKYKTLDGRKGIAKTIDKLAILINSKKVYDDKLPAWVTDYFKENNFKINPVAASLIAESVGNNMSRLANECDKLLINIKPGTEITEQLVEKYVGISKEYNVFELQKAIGVKDILKANKILKYFEADPKSNPAIPIVTILFTFFTKVLLIHGTEDKNEKNLASVLEVNPWFMKDYMVAARNYPPMKAVNVISYLRQADQRLKGIGASMPEGEVLKELIFKIMH